MEQQNLLHRARNMAAAAEQLAGVLAQLRDATQASGKRMLETAAAVDRADMSFLLHARARAAASASLLVTSERLMASSRMGLDALAPVSRGLAAAARDERTAHRTRIGISHDAIARSRALLAQPVLRPETPPAWRLP